MNRHAPYAPHQHMLGTSPTRATNEHSQWAHRTKTPLASSSFGGVEGAAPHERGDGSETKTHHANLPLGGAGGAGPSRGTHRHTDLHNTGGGPTDNGYPYTSHPTGATHGMAVNPDWYGATWTWGLWHRNAYVDGFWYVAGGRWMWMPGSWQHGPYSQQWRWRSQMSGYPRCRGMANSWVGTGHRGTVGTPDDAAETQGGRGRFDRRHTR